MKTMIKEAESIAAIVAAETGEIIKVGELPNDWYPKLMRAMTKMHLELQEVRKGGANNLSLDKN